MLPWRQATQQALYGPSGFFTTGAGPHAHFRTSVHAAPEFAEAIARLATDVDVALGRTTFQIVDVGAGDGELLTQLDRSLPHSLSERAELTAVEMRERPPALPASIRWAHEIPRNTVGLIVANEWLDNVPLDVVERTEQGVVRVLVDTAGRESLGEQLQGDELRWLQRWWPLDGAETGDRAEIGLTRDIAWRDAVRSLKRGVAIAIDYAHSREARVSGTYAAGTLRGFRDGRLVAPTPDGSCDVTAHVAMDACLSATAEFATESMLTTQRQALMSLGVRADRPPIEEAHDNPGRYVLNLAAASRAGELLNKDQLGRYSWLVQSRGMKLPASLSGLVASTE